MQKENLYIIGDAEQKLKTVASGSVKLIYIDPPYNTGSKFIYNDKRAKDEWAEFMEPKLADSRRVLSDDGVIFISIDDSEYVSLRIICDKIFGPANHLGTLITRQATRSNSKHINTIHEYVVCYAKNKLKTGKFETDRLNIPLYEQAIKKITRSVSRVHKASGQQAAESHLKELLKHYDHVDGFSWLKNYNMVDKDGRVYFAKDLSAPGEPNRLTIPEIGLDLAPLKSRRWSSRAKMVELHQKGLLSYKNGRPYRKSLLVDSKDSLMSMLNFYSRQGTHDLDRLGLKRVFDTPKPVDMIKLFILCVCSSNDTVLDYFAGSATTGQAVWEVNKNMGYNLNFILIQLPEPLGDNATLSKLLTSEGLPLNIASIGILRLNRASQKLGSPKFTIVN